MNLKDSSLRNHHLGVGEPLEKILLDHEWSNCTINIGATLSKEKDLVNFFHVNSEVFTWTPSDMLRMNETWLNIDSILTQSIGYFVRRLKDSFQISK